LPLLRPAPFQAGRSMPPWARPQAVELQGPGLLIIDEATYLDQVAADCVANLAEEARIGAVFIGNLDLHRRWFPSRAGERLCSAQFAARFARRLVLEEVHPPDAATILSGCGIAGRPEVEYLTRIARGFGGLHGLRHVLGAAAHVGQSWPPRLDQLKAAAALCGLDQ
jgi:hypothetical protein